MDIFLFRLLLHVFLLLPLVSSQVDINSVQYFINCGSRNPSVKVDDRDFVGDEALNGVSVGNSQTVLTQNPSSPETIYQTARIYRKSSSFELRVGVSGTYIVRFHFFPFISSHGIDLSEGIFNVSAGHFVFLSNFSVRNRSSLPIIMEYFLNISSGKFQIDFVPEISSFAFVNAIEAILLPPDFITDYAAAVPPVVASTDGLFHGLESNALRTVYRVNVGGSDVNDSGSLWRRWEQDDNYIVSNGYSEKRSSNIDFSKDLNATDNIAPSAVYGSYRLVNSSGGSITNLTWRFLVKRNAEYFVRLHFANFISLSKSVVLRFNVFVNSELAVEVGLNDTISPEEPFFFDLVDDSDNSGNLKISIVPREDSDEKVAFLNGLEIMEFVSNTSFESNPHKGKNHHPFLVIESACGASLAIILMAALFIGLRCRKSKHRKPFPAKSEASYWRGKSHSWIIENPEHRSPATNFNLKLKMPLSEILAATQNFDTRLLIGEGGFGKVYRGTLQGGVEVAVKRSDSSNGQGIYEFQTEVVVLSKIRHRHLVSLIGYCHDGNEMILVYEFMEKGTLRDHLYNWKGNSESDYKPSELTWKQRLEICIGAAKGLHYLHTGSDGGIIHRDVKSTNILLNEKYEAKVADFGLSRTGPSDADHYSTDVKGSFGYLDPEYFRTYQLTDKSDVYSFGVVLLEVLCARRPIVNSTRTEEINLAEWGMYWIKKGQPETVIDPVLAGQINPNSLKKFGEIVEKCLNPEGGGRPSMLDVCWDLEYALQLQKTPLQREPDEDSTPYASSNMILHVQDLNSAVYRTREGSMVGEDDNGTDLSGNGVFTKSNVGGAR